MLYGRLWRLSPELYRIISKNSIFSRFVFFPSSCASARVDLLPPVSCKFSVICDKVIGKYLNKETCLS